MTHPVGAPTSQAGTTRGTARATGPDDVFAALLQGAVAGQSGTEERPAEEPAPSADLADPATPAAPGVTALAPAWLLALQAPVPPVVGPTTVETAGVAGVAGAGVAGAGVAGAGVAPGIATPGVTDGTAVVPVDIPAPVTPGAGARPRGNTSADPAGTQADRPATVTADPGTRPHGEAPAFAPLDTAPSPGDSPTPGPADATDGALRSRGTTPETVTGDSGARLRGNTPPTDPGDPGARFRGNAPLPDVSGQVGQVSVSAGTDSPVAAPITPAASPADSPGAVVSTPVPAETPSGSTTADTTRSGSSVPATTPPLGALPDAGRQSRPDQADDHGTDPLPAVGGQPAAPAAPAPAAASSAPGPAPRADAPPVAAQLTPQLLGLTSSDGTHTVTVVLAPESLGEVRVQVVVTGDDVQLVLASGQEHGRAALAEALPELRRDLAAAGLTVTTADVTSDVTANATGGSSGGAQTGSGWGGRPDATDRWAPRVPTGVATADDDSGTTRTTGHTRDRSAAAGVDVRV